MPWIRPFPILILFFALFLLLRSPALLRQQGNITWLQDAMNGRFPTTLTPSPTTSLQARALAKLEPAQAEFWLQQGLTDNGRSLTTFELCRHYWQTGHQNEAVAACQAGQIPATYWVNLGLAAEEEGNFDLALSAYETAVAIDPSHTTAWYRLGHIQFIRQAYAQVIPAHHQALATGYPPQSSIFEEIGRAHLQLGDLAVAKGAFAEGLRLFPHSRPLYHDMVTLSRQEQDWQTADTWLATLLEKWPEDASAWALRGDIALQQNNLAPALTYYQQAVHQRPNAPGYWAGLAQAAVRLDDISQANSAYDSMLALDPPQPSLWLQAGEFFLKYEQFTKAHQAFSQVLILQPTNEQAKKRLAELEGQ